MSEPEKWSREWWTHERLLQLSFYEDPSAATDPDVRDLLNRGNSILFNEDVPRSELAERLSRLLREHGVPEQVPVPR